MANIKINLKPSIRKYWPAVIRYYSLILLQSRCDGNNVIAIVTVDEEVIYFDEAYETITHSKLKYAEDNYDFIRYLGSDETVTVSGDV